MQRFVVLLRGINVGGKNKIPMAELKQLLLQSGYSGVVTYIQSGNILVSSTQSAAQISGHIETVLGNSFDLDSAIVRTLVLSSHDYDAIMQAAPPDFGVNLTDYRYDVIFLFDHSAEQALSQISVRAGVDSAWPGPGVVYYRRPSLTSPDVGKSHLSKLAGSALYAAVTIRNWNTCSKLTTLLDV